MSDRSSDGWVVLARFLIPYVDVGVNIRAIKELEPHGPRVAIGGNVFTLIPGGFCMCCSGFLSKEKLATELRGPDRSYFENREGEAQAVGLNGLVASQAVTEVLQLFTGFGGTGLRLGDIALNGHPGTQRGFRKLDGGRGTLEDWGDPAAGTVPSATRPWPLVSSPGCPHAEAAEAQGATAA